MSRRSRVQRLPKQEMPQVPLERPGRLRTLICILALTTLLLVTHQLWRLKYSPGAKSKDVVNSAAPAAPPTMGMQAYPDPQHGSDIVDAGNKEELLGVQFDDDGEMDLATMQRMLDILYKRPQNPEGYDSVDGDATEYRFRKKVEH